MARFENKKPNKDDHKNMKRAAQGVKNGVGVVAVVWGTVKVIKKYGSIVKDIILK